MVAARSSETDITRKDSPLLTTHLGVYESKVAAAFREIRDQRIVDRIWSRDHTVWKQYRTEITNRLGWLDSVDAMRKQIDRLETFATEIRGSGYTDALLLGMGGSSLAPELFRRTFGIREGFLDLVVLDSTDPGAVRRQAERLQPAKTLIIVSTKSGGTVETLSLFKYFYNWLGDTQNSDGIGAHFAAITDPGSKLFHTVPLDSFRAVFLNDPSIGGRYSALSLFGLVPAALLGIDIERLLERARPFIHHGRSVSEPTLRLDKEAARLGAILGELASTGRDKLTLIASQPFVHFGDWVEQLVAESTGKEGKGILPVVGESLGNQEVYGADRLFVHMRLDGDDTFDKTLEDLMKRGHPLVRIHLRDSYDLGGQFFLWEMATAVAASRLGINPFDQPNVESAKRLASETVAEYWRTGKLPTYEAEPLSVKALRAFVDSVDDLPQKPEPSKSYVAIHAYVTPGPEMDEALARLRIVLRDHLRVAVTVGYGPRFLHSTGQLHKGDAGNGHFVQLVSTSPDDLPIPDETGSSESTITFDVLKRAQALGDARALAALGRRVICFDVDDDVPQRLTEVAEKLLA